MLKPLTGARRRTALADLGVIRVQGADAIKFLQGQLSNDTTKLDAGLSLLAGLHNAQGRAIAILRLVLVGPDEVLGILPRELAGTVAARLSKFVLRAKAKVADASTDYLIEGVEAEGPQAWVEATPGAVRHEADGSISICAGLSPLRWLALGPATAHATGAATSADSASEDREHWRALDVADGIAQVYAATSEAFVAQMLNLDVAGGISFDKGCYTGQEVIARAHYRGKVKRRMQRFVTTGPAHLAAGDSGTLLDGRTFKVVDAVRRPDGTVEFLAVAPTAHGTDDATPASPEPGAASMGSHGSLSPIDARQVPLPYDLPV